MVVGDEFRINLGVEIEFRRFGWMFWVVGYYVVEVKCLGYLYRREFFFVVLLVGLLERYRCCFVEM